uniref:Mannan endo-1,6-alpha-mannosidase n=1 Tax=Bionectria ochroleuca TaxID=29856 RepID=A0A8H7KAQ9_BIOOC
MSPPRSLGTLPKGLLVLCMSLFLDVRVAAQYYKISTKDEIKQSARTLAYDLMLQYTGNQTGMIPGILPGPPTEHKGDYYWWQGGAMMGTYIDYWKLTGDTSYNAVVTQGMLHQTGDNGDYMPENHTLSLGNDDQGFWGMSALLAAENKFPDPPEDQYQWLELAQAVWNTQVQPKRHDSECNGGMRWQIPSTNTGYNYKNTISNGIFFNMGARLARYTDNATYAEHAEKTWDWLWGVNYIDHDTWNVYDGGHIEHNCTDIDKQTFSYNAAVLLQGSAFMHAFTKDEKWKTRLDKLLEAVLKRFFPENVAYEASCEPVKGTCTPDMLSFKGYLHRWMATVGQVAPHTHDTIKDVLRKSTEAAISQCTGGDTGRACGFYWSERKFYPVSTDRTSGAGEAMNVLAAVSSLLIDDTEEPTTNKTGGTSKGNPNAGEKSKDPNMREFKPITAGDRAGASILTILLALGSAAFFYWITAT